MVYHYDQSGQLIAETDATGNMLKVYIWLFGQPLAMIASDGAVYYFHNDHLGTPQKMTDATGAVVWAADYLPFGQADVTIATVDNNLRFAGQYYDQETELHFNHWRFYDPKLGRYLRADPTGLYGGLNLYAYAENNPINMTDSSGTSPIIEVEILLEILIDSAEYNIDEKYRLEELEDKENERRRKLIGEWESKKSECYKLAKKILRQCDEACIQRFPNDDCQRQQCHMDCYRKKYMQQVKHCQWIESQLNGLPKPNVKLN